MDSRLYDLLNEVGEEKSRDGDYNYSCRITPPSYWKLDQSKLGSFWTSYCSLVEIKDEKSSPLLLAERTYATSPIVIDFRFRFLDAGFNDPEPYTDDFLYAIIHHCQDVIVNLYNVDPDPQRLICCVLESDEYIRDSSREEASLIFYLRLHFPFCRVETSGQTLLLPQIIKSLKINNIAGLLSQQLEEYWDNTISIPVANGFISLYGSNNSIDIPNISLRGSYEYIHEDVVLGTAVNPEDYGIEEKFNPLHHEHFMTGLIDRSIVDNSNKPISFWLPLLFSPSYYPIITLPKNKSIRNNISRNSSSKSRASSPEGCGADIDNNNCTKKKGLTFNSSSDPFDIVKQLLPLLSPERFREPYNTDIGKAIYYASRGNEEGLILWSKFCELPAHSLREGYSQFTTTTITHRTIAWFALKDDPSNYSQWHSRWCSEAFETSASASHTDVAVIFYKLYWLNFLYSQKRWYYFRDHRFIEDESGEEVRKCFSSNFVKRYEEYRMKLSEKIFQSSDESYRKAGEDLMKRLNVLIGKLKNVTYKANLLKECAEQFSRPDIFSKFNSNPDLLGIFDGIIDANSKGITFRDGKPEDFVTKFTPISLRREFSKNHINVQIVKKWIRQVFRNKELRRHFWKFSASCLRGRNSDKLFLIWSGVGDNSKSMIVKLFEAAFGTYCVKFPVTLLTQKRTGSSNATPEIARATNARIAFIQEPDNDEELKAGSIKEFTGGDTIYARMLHDNGGDMQALFKLVFICNTVPDIPGLDKAIVNRLRIFPFSSIWVNDAPEDEEEQMRRGRFKRDESFEDHIPNLAPAFLWLLVTKWYPIYIKEKLSDPMEVKSITQEYIRDHDMYGQYIAERIVQAFKVGTKEIDDKAYISVTHMLHDFKDWQRENFPDKKKQVDRTTLRIEISNRIGKPGPKDKEGNATEKNRWYGIRLMKEEQTDTKQDLMRNVRKKN